MKKSKKSTELAMVRLQPKDLPNRRPYPFFVTEDAMIGRQDFWQGRPKKILGLSIAPKTDSIDLRFEQFWSDPQKGLGMYPVFENEDGSWTTYQLPIEEISVKYKDL